MEDDKALDFKLVEKQTFLEYLPVCQTRRSASCPGRLSRASQIGNFLAQAPGRRANQSRNLAGNPARHEATLSASIPHTGSASESMDSQESLQKESTPDGQEIERSAGSSMHPHRCKPCAWFWRTAGCARGAACQHCHMCLPGELVKRRRQNRALAKSIRKLAKEAPPQTRTNNPPAEVPITWRFAAPSSGD
ncbi:unnamed protein product [Effrenium voratum]|nr:unnamed protein product [Effrenium voratum]